MFAEGMVDDPLPSHPHSEDIVSTGWGSYFYYPLPARTKVTSTRAGSAFLQKAPSFDSATGNGSFNPLPPRAPSVQNEEMKRAITLRRVSSMKTAGDAMEAASIAAAGFAAAAADGRGATSSNVNVSQRQRRSGSHCQTYSSNANISEPPSRGDTPSMGSHNPSTSFSMPPGPGGITSVGLPGYGMSTVPAANTAALNPQQDESYVVKGPKRINTLWGTYVRDYAKMCIPDVDVLVDYPLDYEFPVFCHDKTGAVIESGFFPSDPISLHADPPHFLNVGLSSNSQAPTMSANVSNNNLSKSNSSLQSNTKSTDSSNNYE